MSLTRKPGSLSTIHGVTDGNTRFHDPLPPRADVVVIGGGAIGVFAALNLVRRGLTVLVCEKGRIAGEQSSRNWGWIRQQGRHPAELPIMMEANRLWLEIDRQTGGRTGLRTAGICYLASSERELARITAWTEIAREHQLETRLLGRTELDALIDRGTPAGARRHEWLGGVVTPDDARAEPGQAIPAIAELAHNEGVLIRENCAVRALDVTNGRIAGVITEAGRVATGQVVLAGGAWSSLLARRHGIAMPQLSVRATAAQTAPLPCFYDGAASDGHFAFRRRLDGGYTLAISDLQSHFIGPDSFRHFRHYLPAMGEHIGETRFSLRAPKGFPDSWGLKRSWAEDEISPFEAMRILDPAPDPKAIAMMVRCFVERFPAIGKPAIQNAWAGMIDTLPDILPVLDHAPHLQGLIIATGMSGHGFGIAPGFGKIIASMVEGQPTGYDLGPFRLSRF